MLFTHIACSLFSVISVLGREGSIWEGKLLLVISVTHNEPKSGTQDHCHQQLLYPEHHHKDLTFDVTTDHRQQDFTKSHRYESRQNALVNKFTSQDVRSRRKPKEHVSPEIPNTCQATNSPQKLLKYLGVRSQDCFFFQKASHAILLYVKG